MQEQSAEERIKKNTQSSLVQRFVEVMEEYQGIQARFKSQHQENVKRQVLVGTFRMHFSKTYSNFDTNNSTILVRPEATIEEIAEVIESGEAERIFADHSMKREQAAKQALSYIRVCI
jgi:t-SNARE complex subunit (syntaxin)